MAHNVTNVGGIWPDLTIDSVLLTDSKFDRYTDSNGVFTYKGLTIKPSGSVRVGEVKIHPSGLIQIGDQSVIRLPAIPMPTIAAKNAARLKALKSNQSTSRSALSESSSKANVQPKKRTNAEKDIGATVHRNAGRETLGQAAGSKRKSTDTAPKSAKKQKTVVYEEPTATAETRSVSVAAPPAVQNIYDVELEGQWSDNVPVYESCDQIRRKIDVYLAQPAVTKAQFCRDLTNQLYSPSAPKNIQSKMLEDFRKKHGASGGCTSSVFYAAYVFFERLRIVRNEAKSKHRLEMEKVWPRGMDRDRDVTNRGILCGPGGQPHQDSYGRWSVRY